MNCFVIMPFATEFDDVYAVIRATIESATAERNGRCFRLDEARPAGRITDRLLSELRAATVCVADVTGSKPNVMWEVGFAMALGKPVVVITQNLSELPFDIQDLQSIEYTRSHLNASLATPLRRMAVDTLAGLEGATTGQSIIPSNGTEVVGTLLKEVAQLREMVSEAVRGWRGLDAPPPQALSETQSMEGHWFNKENGSHVYSRVIQGELIAPYCYLGDTELTGVYFGWRRTGDYWFARYQWLEESLSGFSFLRRESVDSLTGAWWSSEHEPESIDLPPRGSGVPAHWVHRPNKETPAWAEVFFQKVEREGLASCLVRTR
jgi:hypothetical protein